MLKNQHWTLIILPNLLQWWPSFDLSLAAPVVLSLSSPPFTSQPPAKLLRKNLGVKVHSNRAVQKTTSIPPINFYFSQNNRIYGPDSQQIHSGKITNLFVRNFGISKRSTCQENKSCPSPIPKHFTTTPGYRRGDSVFLQLENRSSWHTNFLRKCRKSCILLTKITSIFNTPIN